MTISAVSIHRPSITSFDLNKLITTSRFFSKVELSPATKLVLRCLVDHWNPNKGMVFPKQSTIAEETGLSRVCVTNAVSQLIKNRIVLTIKNNSRLTYYFTNIFFELLAEGSKQTLPNIEKTFTQPCKDSLPHGITNKSTKLKNKSFIKINDSSKNSLSGIKETQLLIEKYKQDRSNRKSPYDDYDTAVYWLKSLDERTLKLKCIRDQVEKVIRIWSLDKDFIGNLLENWQE